MTTAIIGVGKIGSGLARNLVRGGEHIVLGARPHASRGTSAGSVVAGLLPAGARYVKAFGTLAAPSLAAEAYRTPRRAALFYATDNEAAGAAAERLITAAGFEPVKAGGAQDAARLEIPGGDLYQNGGLNRRILDLDEARAAVASTS